MGDTVTISGKRDAVALKEDESYHRKERNGSTFSRTLQLPFKVQDKAIDARYEKGILKLTLPVRKREAQEDRRQGQLRKGGVRVMGEGNEEMQKQVAQTPVETERTKNRKVLRTQGRYLRDQGYPGNFGRCARCGRTFRRNHAGEECPHTSRGR
jgi:predicted DNA-binding antitoxin AbrB/MazE fold protein